MVGSNFLVEGAVPLARALGLSELVIGLTVIAVGTSLPELAPSILPLTAVTLLVIASRAWQRQRG